MIIIFKSKFLNFGQYKNKNIILILKFKKYINSNNN